MLKSSKLLTNNDMKLPIAEAYKALRTNIQFSFTDSGSALKTILITSSGPSEGKSSTAANLAITMAQSDSRVLLVDCDLRKPVVHRDFNLVNAKGLTNLLVEGSDYDTLVNMTAVDKLEVITSGPKPPNPSELLGSFRMKALIDKLKEKYDTIILDSPPALPVTDAAVLSRVADGTVLVAEYGQTTYELLAQTKSMFEKLNARILGVVLNRIPSNDKEYYYYYYQEDHGNSKRNNRKTNTVKAQL